jgi:hypothetical protein
MKRYNYKNCYYVYIYCDPRKVGLFRYGYLGIVSFKCEPFYVGKGKGDRYLQHRRKSHQICDTNTLKVRKINNITEAGLEPIIIVFSEFTEQQAFIAEKEFIKDIGRMQLKNGPLTNMTDGGEVSTTGYKHTDATKKIMSEKREKYKRCKTDEEIEYLKNHLQNLGEKNVCSKWKFLIYDLEHNLIETSYSPTLIVEKYGFSTKSLVYKVANRNLPCKGIYIEKILKDEVK